MPPSSMDNIIRCTYCDKSFTLRKNKRRHELNVHLKYIQDHVSQIERKTIVQCNECETNYLSLSGYREHRQQVHGIEIKKMEYRFGTQQGNIWFEYVFIFYWKAYFFVFIIGVREIEIEMD